MPTPANKLCATCGAEYGQDTLFCPADGTPLGGSRTQPGDDPYLGAVIADQIEIRQLIGIGSMGRVYRGYQRGVERDVAVKVLHRELSTNQVLVGRFLREARVSSRLSHPNVVQVLMAGQLLASGRSSDPGGALYIVMEYLDGLALASALAASGGALALPRALRIVLQICDAVGEAHAQGVVHRDVKPENVMLVRRSDDQDFVKVLDFGIARFNWGEDSATQAGLIFGTARYISPEGAVGQPVSFTADVYSIATILYQCLAGRTPFDSDVTMALLMQHAHTPPPLLSLIARAAYVPGPLASVVMANLAKDPSERAPDARMLGRQLVEAAKASGLSAEDLIGRSAFLGQRASAGALFSSIQRTNKMPLSAELAARIGAPASDVFSAEIGPTPSMSAGLAGGISSVGISEQTHDDAQVSGPVPLLTRPMAPATLALRESAIPNYRAGMPSGVESTLDDNAGVLAPAAVPTTGGLRRAFAIGCLLGCVALGVYGLSQTNIFGRGRASDARQAYVDKASDAIRAHRWSEPPGDNVRDLLTEGLEAYPQDPSLLETRERAAEELLATALGLKYAGDVGGALSLAMLARDLDDRSTTAQHMVRELQALRDAAKGDAIRDAASNMPMPSLSATGDPKRGKGGRNLAPLPSRSVPSRSSSPSEPLPSSSNVTVEPAPAGSAPGRWL